MGLFSKDTKHVSLRVNEEARERYDRYQRRIRNERKKRQAVAEARRQAAKVLRTLEQPQRTSRWN